MSENGHVDVFVITYIHTCHAFQIQTFNEHGRFILTISSHMSTKPFLTPRLNHECPIRHSNNNFASVSHPLQTRINLEKWH